MSIYEYYSIINNHSTFCDQDIRNLGTRRLALLLTRLESATNQVLCRDELEFWDELSIVEKNDIVCDSIDYINYIISI